MVVLAALGFAAGLLVMVWRYRTTTTSAAFVERPETLTWVMTLAFSTAFWAVASVRLWLDVWMLKGIPRPAEKAALALGALAFFAMLAAPLFVGRWITPFFGKIPLADGQARIAVLYAIGGLLVVLPGVLSIWLHALHFTRQDYVGVAVGDDGVRASQRREGVK